MFIYKPKSVGYSWQPSLQTAGTNMAMRCVGARGACLRSSSSSSKMEGIVGGRLSRCFGDGKGRVLSEEERAKEAVYIQKMERERLEKLKKKMEKEKAAEAQKKKVEEPHKE